jgi:polyhydroxyalkanoate synthase subunit PhaC
MPDAPHTAYTHPHDTMRPPDMAALAALWQAWLPHSSAQPSEPLAEAAANDPLLRGIDDMLNRNPLHDVIPVDWGAIARALRMIASRSLAHPVETMFSVADLTMRAWSTTFNIWNDAVAQWWGVPPSSPPARSADKRFGALDWTANPTFRTYKELYQLASEWLLKQGDMPDLEPAQRQWMNFHLRQFVDAMSPALSPATNPEVLHRAVQTGGTNFADGARNLMHDLREGRLSMVDTDAFSPGRNLALSPGKVVYRNKLIELIQYAPTTETVHATPLLIIPPWINKFYILDMQPQNSLVRYLVSQGITVFMISWKNPDASMEDTTIEDYMDLGPLAASDVIREITGAPKINVMGYCIGGTLLVMALAWLTAKHDDRFNAATFIVSLQDFSRVGDTAVFLGEPAIDYIEQEMMTRGYLDSREMSNMFNLLRSNDLIWSNVVNNYLLGNPPPAFDLLYWNNDGTRMARVAHSWYLRNTYVENNLIVPGKIELKGEKLDLRQIKLDIYAVGAERDHIVPWDAAWRITQLARGDVRFILASSGHIAGIINPPGGKGTFFTLEEKGAVASPAHWRQAATRHDGSWWTDWARWLNERGGEKGPPPGIGSAKYPPLADAPGVYVLEK